MTKNLALQAQGFNTVEVSVYDFNNPRSVVNLIPDRMKKTVEKIPHAYRTLDEKAARAKFRPSPAMNQLRASFWVEYNRVQAAQSGQMEMVNIYRGIVSRDYFEDVVCFSKETLAWLFLPPQSYTAVLNEALESAINQLREILDLPTVDKKGKVSTSIANLKIKVFTLLDQRVHGGVVNKNFNVNLTGDEAKAVALAAEGINMEALDKRIETLRSRAEKGAFAQPDLEASPKEAVTVETPDK